MRRTLGTMAAAGLLATLLMIPAHAQDAAENGANDTVQTAPAQPDSAPADKPTERPQRPEREQERRFEKLEMRCAYMAHEDNRGVGCQWTPSKHPNFAAYELWRGDREGNRVLVLRATDRRHTRGFDADVPAETKVVYAVRVVDADGQTLGGSRVVAPSRQHAGHPDKSDYRARPDGDNPKPHLDEARSRRRSQPGLIALPAI